MRYSYSAVVLATLSVGYATAGSVHHRHAHDKRAPAPTAAPAAEPVDYYMGKPIVYSVNQQWGTWGGAPANPAPSNPPVVENAVVDNTPKAKVDDTKKVDTTEKKVVSTGAKGGTAGDMSAAIFKQLNAVPMKSSGQISDSSGEYTMDLVNSAGQELGFYCWPGSSGWNIGTDAPIYATTIPKDRTHTIYLGGQSSKIACTALHTGAKIDQSNGISIETQIEFTFVAGNPANSVFDVSQLETASGHHVSMQSSVCTSESNGHCSFQCNGSAPCGYTAGQVSLKDCLGTGTAGNGAADGGCQTGSDKHVKVTFS